MAGLEQVGIPGPEHLRETLTNCTDPLAAIEEFQLQNGILLPSLRPALPFLDLHGVLRLDFHTSVLDELRDKLLQRIAEIAASEDKNKLKLLNDLLVKSFPVIKVKCLRAVVLCILKYLPKIKPEYLKTVLDDPELYAEASVEVKQQIWQDNQALFGDEVSPLLARYIEDKEKVMYSHQSLTQHFFSPLPKARRNEEVVQQIVKMIGKNLKLYDLVLQFLRTLFLRTRNVHYCTLRAEILMSLHDSEINEICSLDPCHKFTWCLDACIRERFIDNKRAKELQGFLDGIRRGQEQVLGDICMILCDPFAIHTIMASIMKCLQHCLTSDTVPRLNEELVLLLRMLSLGLGAWEMIDSQQFKETKLETSLVTKFLPEILNLMVDDQLHSVTSKIPEEPTHQPEAAPRYLSTFANTHEVATTVLAYYTIHVAKQRDHPGILRIIPSLCESNYETVYQDTTLHLLVTYFALMSDQFSNNDFYEAVLVNFFMTQVSSENICRHMMRLLWWIHPKLNPIRLSKLMEKLKPSTQQSEDCHKEYSGLQAKISSHQPSPVQEPEKLDSPLRAVPAPTPAHY